MTSVPSQLHPRGGTGSKLWDKLAISTNWPVLLAVAVLAAVGVATIWADSPKTGRSQLMYLVVATACLALFQAVDYRILGRFSIAFYALSLALILYTVIGTKIPLPGVTRRNGAYNWIAFGSASLQPAELMKVAFVMLMARFLRFRSNYRTLRGLIAPFALALVPVALILKQPDLGTAILFIPALFVLLFVAGAKIRHLLTFAGIGFALCPLMWLSGTDLPVFRHTPKFVKDYQRERVFAMFNSDPRTLESTGFQQQHALIAFGSGGIGGKGAGNIEVGRHVPEAHNDMIFALIGEQFGFFGTAVVLAAYLILFTAGIEIAASTREPFGRLVAVGVVTLLAAQTFLNLMVCVKLMPVTGVTLPFISAGGSSLVASFMAAGLLLNIGQNRPLVMANDSFEY